MVAATAGRGQATSTASASKTRARGHPGRMYRRSEIVIRGLQQFAGALLRDAVGQRQPLHPWVRLQHGIELPIM